MGLFYHVSPERGSKSILRQGLRRRGSGPVFLSETLQQAIDNAAALEEYYYEDLATPGRFAVFEVTLPEGVPRQVGHEGDISLPGGDTEGEVQVYQSIPARNIVKLGIYDVTSMQWE